MAPLVIEIDNLRSGYFKIIDHVLTFGEESAPRGRRTVELLNPTIVLADPSDSLPVGVGRNVNTKIAAVEAVQLCGAFSNPGMVLAASPNFRQFMEDDGTFHGAYGERIGMQLFWAVEKLKNDPDTRQAVISLWNSHRDNVKNRKDYPCTIGFQLYLRSGKLHMTSMMRSNDVWLGLAYDLFQFSQLQWTAANMLGVEAGPLTHRVTSLHVYEGDMKKIEEIGWESTANSPNRRGFLDVERAFSIGNGILPHEPTPTEAWFHSVVGPLYDEMMRGTDD